MWQPPEYLTSAIQYFARSRYREHASCNLEKLDVNQQCLVYEAFALEHEI